MTARNVTAAFGANTFHGFRQIDNADSLFASAFSSTPVMAGRAGYIDAELTVDLTTNVFVMTRRIPNGPISTHTVAIAATGPERLLAHWKGFVGAAVNYAEHA